MYIVTLRPGTVYDCVLRSMHICRVVGLAASAAACGPGRAKACECTTSPRPSHTSLLLCAIDCAAAGAEYAPEVGNYFQRQAMGVPSNASDPLLKHWTKPDPNPFQMQVRGPGWGGLACCAVLCC